MLARMWQNRNPYTLLVGMQVSTTTVQSNMDAPQKKKKKKLEIELPYDPVIMLLGIYPKECKSGYSRDTCTPMFITAQFTTAKVWKKPRCPTTDEWTKKLWYICTMEFYTAIRNNDMWFECK
jgi:hypothetical protein